MAERVFGRPACMTDRPFSYCSGCGHGLVHRLVAELVDEFGIADRTVGVAPVGCAVTAYDYFRFDFCEAAHGRAAAVATGIKRGRPDLFVFTYQGDGDLAAIGLAETLHAANRGEAITVVFVNNTVYGMTGGQMAPTTVPGQPTATTPKGRDPRREGHPIRMAELVASLESPAYVVRTSVASAAGIARTKRHLRNAFRVQLEHGGYAFVEILSQCPTNLGRSPLETNAWIESELTTHFPTGIYKDRHGLG